MSGNIAGDSASQIQPGKVFPTGAPGRQFAKYVTGNFGALLIGLVVAYLFLLRGNHVTSEVIKTGDFIAYYSGSHLVATGHGGHLYDFATLGRLQTHLLRPLVLRGGLLMPYLYPPFLALLLAPLARLSYSTAYMAWLLVNCLLLVFVMFTLERYSGLGGRTATAMRLSAICFLPVLLTLFNGQTSLVILAAFTLSFWAAHAGHDIVAGASLAGGLIKPQYVVPLLVVLVLRRRWRSVASFAAMAAGLFAIPTLILRPSVTEAYARTLRVATTWRTQFGYAPARNHSFAGFAQLLLGGEAASVIRFALCLLAVGLLVACSLRATTLELPFGLAIVVALLISPHVLVHDLALLLLPAAIALAHQKSGSRTLAVLLVGGYAGISVGYWSSFSIPLQISVLAMCSLAVWLFMRAELPRRVPTSLDVLAVTDRHAHSRDGAINRMPTGGAA